MATKTMTRGVKQTKNTGRTTKKPVARQRVQSAPTQTGRFFLENARWIALAVSAVILGVLLFFSYQAATASAVFQIKTIDINGTSRASNSSIETIAKRLTAKSGIWNADLDLVRSEIERLSWVKSAVVSRVLPDGLRVRVTERTPQAVVRLESGKLVWVDDEAKILGAVLSEETTPPFALLGWNENDADAARRNNQERVQLYLKLLEEWQKLEIANRVTAIDLKDMQNLEAFVAKNDFLIPVELGKSEFSQRLKAALNSIEQHDRVGRLAEVEKIIIHSGDAIIAYKAGTQADDASTARKKR